MKPTTSIRRRLIVYLGGGLLGFWLLAVGVFVGGATHEINEMADIQMTQVARTLMHVTRPASATDTETSTGTDTSMGTDTSRGDGISRGSVPDLAELLPGEHLVTEAGDNGFAVWNAQGKRLLADQGGQHIPWRDLQGFQNTGPFWEEGAWRIVRLKDESGGHWVAVAQRLSERASMIRDSVLIQLLVSLLAVPVLLGLLVLGVRRGIRPLDRLSRDLARRAGRDLSPVSEAVPAEALPLVRSLNGLLARVAQTLERERRFTADAAHELRSPLAALKVQADVLAMAEDEESRQHHLDLLQSGIERAAHLVDQLLILARLDHLDELADVSSIDWPDLAREALKSVSLTAREKRVRLRLFTSDASGTDGGANISPASASEPGNPPVDNGMLPRQGNPLLLQLMLRNLLDNAVRYSEAGGLVSLVLKPDEIIITDEGPGVIEVVLARMGERFYRPAGQHAKGSGLGISIVCRIAALHGLGLTLENRSDRQGLLARLAVAGPALR